MSFICGRGLLSTRIVSLSVKGKRPTDDEWCNNASVRQIKKRKIEKA